MDRNKIEQEARRLQFEIWHKRDLLFPFGEPEPVQMCRPDIAARVLDAEYEFRNDLGNFRVDGTAYAVAGMLDRRRGIVNVSTRFGDQAMRFTGAHMEVIPGNSKLERASAARVPTRGAAIL
jgi:hypothetical protein